MVWARVVDNPSDARSKPLAGCTTGLLKELLTFGRLPIDVEDLRSYGPALVEEE